MQNQILPVSQGDNGIWEENLSVYQEQSRDLFYALQFVNHSMFLKNIPARETIKNLCVFIVI